jgi:hypothetical protein
VAREGAELWQSALVFATGFFTFERPANEALEAQEAQLNWNAWIRQIHRWLSILFTLTVIANFVQLGMGQKDPNWVTYSPLLPLGLLLVTGLYMFALPYFARARKP